MKIFTYREMKEISLLVLFCCFCTGAYAERSIQTNGFLTAGFSQNDQDVSYTGVKDEMNFSKLSVIGIQTSFTPNESSIQLVSQLLARGKNSWEIDAEWAYLAYQPNNQVELQAGRFRFPGFMISQYYDVGVSYPWITPPEELYGFANVPITAINGLNAVGKIAAPPFDFVSQIYIAQTPETDLPLIGEIFTLGEFRIGGIILELIHPNITVRASHHVVPKLTAELVDTLAAATGLPVSAINSFGIEDTTDGEVVFSSVGVDISWNQIRFLAEWAHRDVSNSIFSSSQNWFATIGYEFGHLFPHFTYSVADAEDVEFFNQDQHTATLGIKFSMTDSVAVKFEYGFTELDGRENANGLFDSIPTVFGGPTIDDEINTITAAVNLVF